jgi:hypothetical protein
MPTHVGPNISGEENLVFGFDLSDQKNSYLGEPTTNYIPSTYNYGLYAYASGPIDTTVNNEYNVAITAKRYTISNTVNIARAAIFPTTTVNTYYTFSFKWKYNGSTTTTPTMIVSAAKGYPETNNNSFNYQNQTNTQIGNGWYLTVYTFNFSSNPNGACILTFGISTGSNSSYLNETFDIYEGQFEIKDHKTQYSIGTRSNTQGLRDVTGNSTINLSDVSFNSNASMLFDGTNDKIQTVQTTHSYLNSSAIEFVVTPSVINKRMTVGGYRHNEGYSQPTIGMVYIGDDNVFRSSVITAAEVYRSVASTTTIVANQTYHVVLNKNTTTGVLEIFVNGSSQNSTTFNVLTYGQWTTAGSYIGSNYLDFGKSFNTNSGQGWGNDYLNGTIHLFKLYSRTLSSSEVLNNYNNIKRKYGI